MGQKKKNKQLAPDVQYGSGLVEEMGENLSRNSTFLRHGIPYARARV